MSRRTVLRVGLGLAALPALSAVVAACGQQASPAAAPAKPADSGAASSKPADSKPAAPAAAAPAAPAKAGGGEIVYLNQSRGQAKAMEALATRYTEQTGVKVTIDSPGPTDYPQKLQAAANAGNMPDAYYDIGAADMSPYYKAGWALNLKPEMDKGWSKNFAPGLLDFDEYLPDNPAGVPAGIYKASWEVNTYGTLYNPAHLEKAGLDPKKAPATTAEMLDMMKAIKAKNIGPFVVPNTYIPRFVESLASNWLTDQEIDATRAGKASYKADAWKSALQYFIDMRDADVIFNKTLNQTAPDNEKSFFNVQEVALFWTSVVSIPVQVTTAPDFTAYSAFPLPKMPGGKMDPRTFGGTGKNGVVNAKGKNVDESLKYIKWLTEKEQEITFMEMVPLVPTNPAALDPQKVSPQLSTFAGLIDKVYKAKNPMKGPIVEAFMKGVQSMLLKEKTVEQVMDDLEKAQKE
ncbi:MAG: extracellular solute-binding protein [Chloroflexi bacterium]|nr:extracellular solute-binding protein [Chloroflexota bacterium]